MPFRQTFGGATELVDLVKTVLTQCRVTPTETVLVYTDNHSHPHYAAALDALKRGDFDLSANQINTASDPDVLQQVGHSTGIGPLWNTARYKNATLDRLIDQARLTLDDGKRRELYRQIQVIFAKELPYIPFYVQTDAFAMSATLEGVVYDVKSLPMFHAASLRR